MIQKKHRNAIGLFIITGLIGILFSACPTGDDSTDDQNTYTDLSYGSSESQKLDLFFPDTEDEKLNAVLFIHGGAWIGGDKEDYASFVQKMRDRGLIAATMNYRLLLEGAHAGDMLNDVDAAITLIKEKADDKGIAVNKLILMGASAGAHLSLLYSYKSHVASPIPIAFCVGLSSPTDFLDPNYYTDIPSNSPEAQAKFWLMSALTGTLITASNYTSAQTVKNLESISPIQYVASGVPPTLLAVGLKDDTVPPSNTTRLRAALDAVGVVNYCYEYPNSGHGLDDSRDKGKHDELYGQMLQWIDLYGN
jgi:acetyl esterase/lipase